MHKVRVAAAVAALIVWTTEGALAQAQPDRLKRGEYLSRIMDCGGCHTGGALMGKPDPARNLAGSEVGFEIPGVGIFYPKNLTSDPETGLGRWSEADIVKAVRQGVTPEGRQLIPVMPYHAYSALTDADARALAAYIKSLKPIRWAEPPDVASPQDAKAPYLTVVVPK